MPRHPRLEQFVRWPLLKGSVQAATAEELVRGFIAGVLVIVLIWLVIDAPDGADAAVVASIKTLSIAVIAFYFGLHKGTPKAEAAAHNVGASRSRKERRTDTDPERRDQPGGTAP